MNLKKVLMEAGNILVSRGYDPVGSRTAGWHDKSGQGKSTAPIQAFTNYLNSDSTVREVLESLGVEWPVVSAGDLKVAPKFVLILDGVETEFEVAGLSGSMLQVRAVGDGRSVTMVIGEQHVKEKERTRFRQCLADLGCPVVVEQSAPALGGGQVPVGRIGGQGGERIGER